MSEGAIQDFNAEFGLKHFVPELPLLIADHFDMPLDVLDKLALEIGEVLAILRDQVSVAGAPIKRSFHATFVLGYFFLQLGSHLDLEVLGDRKPGLIHRRPWINRVFETFGVGHGELHVVLQPVSLEYVRQTLKRVLQVSDIGCQMLVARLQLHRVVAVADEEVDQRLSQFRGVRTQVQLD